MSLTEAWGVGPVVLDDTVDTVIGGITEQSSDPQAEVKGEVTTSNPDQYFVALYGQEPVASFGTYHLVTALDAIGLAGIKMSSLATAFTMFLTKLDNEGSVAAGAVHRTFSGTKGIVVPQRLTVDHRGDAMLMYQVAYVSPDGTTAPVVIAESVALPTIPDDAERFTLGPVALTGGYSIAQMTGLDLDFGIRLQHETADSDIYPQFVRIVERKPKATIRFNKNSMVVGAAGVPFLGVSLAHASASIYLRKRADGGTFVTDVTAEHIKLTVAGRATFDSLFNASGTGLAESTLTLDLAHDGTNLPIVPDTSSAIT